MIALTEDRTKCYLASCGLPVPKGKVCVTPDEAAVAARKLGGRAVVKALVAAGRRGKAGAVKLVATPEEAAAATRELLGATVAGLAVTRVYVEECVDIVQELYFSFVLEGYPPKALLSSQGGIDIEERQRQSPGVVSLVNIDPLAGVTPWAGVAMWQRAGVKGAALGTLGNVTARLFQAFCGADAAMLEINPLALDRNGKPVLVGAMMAVDECAIARQRGLFGPEDYASASRSDNPRERAVFSANHRIRGGMIRYTELDGDIGLIMCGGGAGLYQHDLILSYGGRPANHSDQNGINVAKLKVLVAAVLENPRVRGLLVGANHQQMTRTDRKMQAIIEVLKEREIDATRFPVVIRMFGPYEDEARRMASQVPGVRYLPREASMADACRLIVALTGQASATGVACA
ncbi:MAG: acetate--CoA ligase family protein [Betaproteobacteria bacterium]|nr:acetate--CoA ligase family protein [Betaproteobacteria bacterium]